MPSPFESIWAPHFKGTVRELPYRQSGQNPTNFPENSQGNEIFPREAGSEAYLIANDAAMGRLYLCCLEVGSASAIYHFCRGVLVKRGDCQRTPKCLLEPWLVCWV
jgi:hypothetical protein